MPLSKDHWAPLHPLGFGETEGRVLFQGIRRERSPAVKLHLPFVQAWQWLYRSPLREVLTPSRVAWSNNLLSRVLDQGGTEQEAIGGLLLGLSTVSPTPDFIENKGFQKSLRQTFGRDTAQNLEEAKDYLQLIPHGSFHLPNGLYKASEPVQRMVRAALMANLDLWVLTGRPPLWPELSAEVSPLSLSTLARQMSRDFERHQSFFLKPYGPEVQRLLMELAQLKGQPLDHGVAAEEQPLSERWLDAVDWAMELHQDQRRYRTLAPYAAHLLYVAGAVMALGAKNRWETIEDAAIAALLHDSIEDQGVKAGEIGQRFGHRVSRWVVDCSQIPYEDWYLSKRDYLNHIDVITEPEPLTIIGADKLHNVRSLINDLWTEGHPSWRRFYKGQEHQLWFYRTAAEKLQRAGLMPALWRPFQGEVVALQLLARNLSHDGVPGTPPMILQGADPIPKAQWARTQRFEELHQIHRYIANLYQEVPDWRRLNHLALSLPPTAQDVVEDETGKKTWILDSIRRERDDALVEAVFQEFIEQRNRRWNRFPHGKKIAHIVVGPMGSGKTSRMVEPLARRYNALMIEADRFKAQLPEFHLPLSDPRLKGLDLNGFELSERNGLGATAVHSESSYMAQSLTDKAIAHGENFVLAYTGWSFPEDAHLLETLHRAGYRTYLHYVEVPPVTAMDRVIQRFKKDGRYPPLEIMVEKGLQVRENYVALKTYGMENGLLRGYSWVRNERAPGEPMEIVEAHKVKLKF